MANRSWDALILADPRFIGGTSAAIATDVRAFRAMGLRVGIRFVYAVNYFDPEDGESPIFDELFSLDGVDKVEGDAPARAQIAFFHHPAIFFYHPVGNPLQIKAKRSVIVTHQPLYWGDGALALDPMQVQRNIHDQFGVRPDWAPISGLCRRQYRTFAPFLRLTNTDWINTFDADEWAPKREKLASANLVVGRHGRPNRDKWPDTGPDLSASLPAGPDTKIRVMGAPENFFDTFGVDTSAWEILAFNQEPVLDFLDSLDVFSYFHSGLWTEAFGRTIAEAMLMETRCILDRALEPTFGKHAIYCAPSEVPSVLARIREDLPGARAAAKAAREHCLQEYSTRSVAARYQALLADTGTVQRRGGTSVGPLTTARKFIGFHRRQRQARKRQAAQ